MVNINQMLNVLG